MPAITLHSGCSSRQESALASTWDEKLDLQARECTAAMPAHISGGKAQSQQLRLALHAALAIPPSHGSTRQCCHSLGSSRGSSSSTAPEKVQQGVALLVIIQVKAQQLHAGQGNREW